MDIKQLFTRWSQIAELKPELFSSLKGETVLVRIGSDCRLIDCRADLPTITEASSKASATVEIEKKDFDAVISGHLEPQVAYNSGLLKVSGDELVLLKFSLVLRDLIALSGEGEGDSLH